MGFFPGTQEWVRNNRGKRAISVRATEVLLYMYLSIQKKGAGVISDSSSKYLTRW